MSARDDILSAIRSRPRAAAPTPPEYDVRASSDLVDRFAEQARRADAEIQFVNGDRDIPLAIAELLRARNLPAIVHVPQDALALPWDTVPNLSLEHSPPGPDATAVAIVPYAIAETGTLAYCSSVDSPASWHFRAGFEIAVLRAENILPAMEDVLAGAKRAGGLPSTVNFVTGPSRTGDIEQTLELGAHGPKAMAILIVRG
jgi:L-lactate dehydrogenase complex protein LldG